MKKIFLALSLSLALTSCSGADTAPTEAEAMLLPAEADEPSLNSDMLMADSLPPPEGSLSTPVDIPPPAPDLPAVPEIAESAPSDPFANTPADSSASTTTDASAEIAPLPEPVAPAATPAGPSSGEALPPVVAGAGVGSARAERNAYQDYREYQDRIKTRAQSEHELETRSLFPHEDGAFQLGLDYIYRPFADYDFDPSQSVKTANSQGGALSFNYFPVRSLSYGRLGLGAQVAAYWSKIEANVGGKTEASNKHLIDTIGARLIYEFQYFLGQTLVPHVFYAYDKVRIREVKMHGLNFPSTRFNASGYGGGLHLNLNRLESGAASKALASSGIRKFYLTYTYLQRAEDTGSSHYLGLRFEY